MRLGLSWTDAATVVVSTVGIYLGFLVLLRIVGQRALAAMSSFDFAAAIALGAVMGRAILGYTPPWPPACSAWPPCSPCSHSSACCAAATASTGP